MHTFLCFGPKWDARSSTLSSCESDGHRLTVYAGLPMRRSHEEADVVPLFGSDDAMILAHIRLHVTRPGFAQNHPRLTVMPIMLCPPSHFYMVRTDNICKKAAD